MKKGYLSQYFEGVALKRLSNVEVNTSKSNQHEFNGSKAIRELLGTSKEHFQTKFLWLAGENEGFSSNGKVTWYDARAQHPQRTEFRLYFESNDVMSQAQKNDLLIVAKRAISNELFIIIFPFNSMIENQLLWLFGVDEVNYQFNYQPINEGHDPEVDFVMRFILEELDIEIEEPDSEKLDEILEPYFSIGFPNTATFSSLARETIGDYSITEDPDGTIMKWMEYEEKLFKRLERHIVSERLEKGFYDQQSTDVNGFIKFSLSVQNRRKSRVGHALENHLEEIFKGNGLDYSRGKITENKSKPDFIFPNIVSYNDTQFPSHKLTMLGVKSSCKDRWRQVLVEADRIDSKHLFTLQPGISEHQTNEMKANNLQLILPQRLHDSYKPNQQDWLMNLKSFIHLLKDNF